MNRRGIEFSLVQLDTDLWQWQFRIGETLTTGKTKTKLRGMAARKAQTRIDHELKKPLDLRRSPHAS
jgi:hypothetical protein